MSQQTTASIRQARSRQTQPTTDPEALKSAALESSTPRVQPILNTAFMSAPSSAQSSPVSPSPVSASRPEQLQQKTETASFLSTYTKAASNASNRLFDFSTRMLKPLFLSSLDTPPATATQNNQQQQVSPTPAQLQAKDAQQRATKRTDIMKSAQISTPLQSGRDVFYSKAIELLEDRFFLFLPELGQKSVTVPPDAHVFGVDEDFRYVRFYQDFGPLSVAHLVRFDRLMTQKLKTPHLAAKKFVIILSNFPDRCTNAILLALSHLVISHHYLPHEAYALIAKYESQLPLAVYRDAGYGEATYWISILDCLNALYKGTRAHPGGLHGPLVDLDLLDTDEFEFYEKVENGDMNWVIPGIFLAMASPRDQLSPQVAQFHNDVEAGLIQRPINSHKYEPLADINRAARVFRDRMNVKAIIRLNNRLYNRETFLNVGLDHYELFFPDGSVPPLNEIVKPFLQLCDDFIDYTLVGIHNPPANQALESERLTRGRGALAIHCKAGLGRTGSLICCWMMNKLGWTARECISWCRLMRPGSVVGPQQNWLEAVEAEVKRFYPNSSTHNIVDEKEADVEVDLTRNDGTDDLAYRTNGMNVPKQPRKNSNEDLAADDAQSKSQKGSKRRHSKLENSNQ